MYGSERQGEEGEGQTQCASAMDASPVYLKQDEQT